MRNTATLASSMKRRIEAAANVVNEARLAVTRGNEVDLSGLEREVEGICAGLAELPAGSAASLKPGLVALVDDLDKLTETLSQAHAKLAKDIGALGTRRRATKAYGQP